MDVKSAFLKNRYLDVETNLKASNGDYVNFNMVVTFDINNIKGVHMEDNENMMIIHIHLKTLCYVGCQLKC